MRDFPYDILDSTINNIKYRNNVVTGVVAVDNGNKTYDCYISGADVAYPNIPTTLPEPDFAVDDPVEILIEYGNKEMPIIIGHAQKIVQEFVEDKINMLVTTLDAYTITANSGYLEGRIEDIEGYENVVRRGFYYGTSTGYGLDVYSTGSFEAGSFNEQATGLSAVTTYHYQAYVHDAYNDVHTGEDMTFVTLDYDYLELKSAGDWFRCSLNGAYIIIGEDGGRLYTSSDYGVNWTERQPAGNDNFRWLSCSVSGAYMIAGAKGGRLWTSSNYGVDWTERRPAEENDDKDWYCCFVNGAYMIAGISSGRLYTSANYGVDWTERIPAVDDDYSWTSCSINGAYMIAGQSGGRLYTSPDYGVNWTERQPAGSNNRNWLGCSVSGAHMIVCSHGFRLWTSSNYGVDWTERRPAGADAGKNWRDCCVDGANMVTHYSSGRLYTSTNYGVTWIEQQPEGDVNKSWLCSYVNGDYIIAGIANGKFWRLNSN
jgi:hypothetical protein